MNYKMIGIEALKAHGRNNELPLLSDTEKIGLKMLIEKYGFNEPIEITKDNTILDGHNRIEIAKELEIKKVPYLLKEFKNEIEEFEYIVAKNSNRRQITKQKESYLRGVIYKEILRNKVKEDLKINTAEELALKYGVSEKTIRRDGEYAEILNKLDGSTYQEKEFKKDILDDKIKSTKEDIKELSGFSEDLKREAIKEAKESRNLTDVLKAKKEEPQEETPQEELGYNKESMDKEKAKRVKQVTAIINAMKQITKTQNILDKKINDKELSKSLTKNFTTLIKKLNSATEELNKKNTLI